MAFNSFTFLVFLAVVYALFQLFSYRGRGLLLLVASYLFYAHAHWPHLGLLIGVTVVTFYGSRVLGSYNSKFVLGAIVILILLPLICFKYINLATGVFNGTAFASLNIFNVLLPIGISFYTFQAVSYVVDVYRGTKMPSAQLEKLALYLAFFPQVLAGPIERGKNLLPQLKQLKRSCPKVSYIGIKYMLWGFFCKLVIADNLGLIVNQILQVPQEQSGGSLSLVFALYSFQIYFDFLGYTTIAIGISRLFSVRLTANFDRPYLSSSIKDFWRRWHITLSRWFRDYLYIPLGGNNRKTWQKFILILTVFSVSGLWHGAAIGFVAWGAYHGLIYVIEDKLRLHIKPHGIKNRGFIFLIYIIKIITTFSLVTFGWVLFRANDFAQSKLIYSKIIFLNNDYNYTILSHVFYQAHSILIYVLLSIALLLDSKRIEKNIIEKIPNNLKDYILELIVINIIIISIVFLGEIGNTNFIYRMF